ncbi:MAG: serine hydrolase domain-containing protein [Longimicrobiales bacterium]
MNTTRARSRAQIRVLAVALAVALPTAARAQTPASDRVDSIFRRFDTTQSPGCAHATVQGDRMVYQRGYGMSNLEHGVPITPGSIFHVASLSKQFAATAIALLAQQGKLSIDDDVRKYVPEVPDFGQRITIRHLVHHTSGLRDQWSLLALAGWRADDPKSEADILGLIAQQRELNFTPGAEHLYSNTGYTLLAVIVKRVSGKSLREFAHEHIFQPLGMTSTHFHDDHTMIVPNRTSAYVQRPGGYAISIPVFDNHGATSLFTTVGDLARWNRNFDDARVGGKALQDLLHTQGVLNDGIVLPYAFGIVKGEYNGLPTVGHSGADAGYRADFLRFPQQGYAFVTLCNLGSTNPGMLNRQVASVFLAEHMRRSVAAEPQPAAVTPAEIEPLVGTYFDARTETLRRATVREGKLVYGVGTVVQLTPLGGAEFRLVGQPVTIAFLRQSSQIVLQERIDGSPPVLLRRVAETPPNQDLKAFEGKYHSAELDVVWTVVARADRLVVERRRFPDSTFEPVFADAFQGPGLLRFTRAARGRIDGFRLGQGRVRNLLFQKQGR